MLTVIFSTYNGSDTLPKMLESLTHLVSPSGGWKLIAIDNASTDNTKSILDSYLSRLPLTILTELQRGKNAALNTGLQYIEGDLVIFTDDDVVVDSNWLVNLSQQAACNPGFDIFAGKILPYWTKPPEQWILEWVNHQIVYALTPSDLKEGDVSAGMVWGGNMAVRAAIFKDGFSFDTTVGPDGTTSYKMGSETSFTYKLKQQGYRCFYVPESEVQHIISEQEMNYEWVLGRATRFGKSDFNNDVINLNPPLLWCVPRYLFRRYLTNMFDLCCAYACLNKKKIFLRHWALNVTRGLMKEAKRYYKQ